VVTPCPYFRGGSFTGVEVEQREHVFRGDLASSCGMLGRELGPTCSPAGRPSIPADGRGYPAPMKKDIHINI